MGEAHSALRMKLFVALLLLLCALSAALPSADTNVTATGNCTGIRHGDRDTVDACCDATVGAICGNMALGYQCCPPGTQCDYGNADNPCQPDRQTYPNGTAACDHKAGEVGCACYTIPACCDPRKATGILQKHTMYCDGVQCCQYHWS